MPNSSLNPFKPGDRVQYKEKNRRNGLVLCIYCGTCINCTNKLLDKCDGAYKSRVAVSFYESISGCSKQFKYHFSELELEPPAPPEPKVEITPLPRAYDFSPKDIRPLGDAKVDIPLIVEDEYSEPEIDTDEVDVELDELEEELNAKTTEPPQKEPTYFEMFSGKMLHPV